MVSTVTPVVYRRHQKANWLVAICFYAISAGIGSAMIGGALAYAGNQMHVPLAPFASGRWLLWAFLSALYALHEGRLIRMPYPQRTWQVPASWRVRFHPWVTASGYGFLIGTGVLTRVSVATLYLFLLWAFLVGAPKEAVPVAAVFGISQALPILICGWNVRCPEDFCRIGSESWFLRPMVHKLNSVVLALGAVAVFLDIYLGKKF